MSQLQKHEKYLYGCVCVCVRVCVYARISASTRSILTEQVSFFLCDCGSKIRFLIGTMHFCFISNFRFSQNYFLLFLMIGSIHFNRISNIRKRIKIHIFSKKKFSSFYGYFVINKNVKIEKWKKWVLRPWCIMYYFSILIISS